MLAFVVFFAGMGLLFMSIVLHVEHKIAGRQHALGAWN